MSTVNNLSNAVIWFGAGYLFKFGWDAAALYKCKRKSEDLWKEYKRELKRSREELKFVHSEAEP